LNVLEVNAGTSNQVLRYWNSYFVNDLQLTLLQEINRWMNSPCDAVLDGGEEIIRDAFLKTREQSVEGAPRNQFDRFAKQLDGGLFTESTTGLDHGGFAVPSRSDLELWQDHLETNGVGRADTADKPLTQSPIADEPYASVLVFRDPDNIQLELFAPALQHED